MLTEKRMQRVLDKVIKNIQIDTDILDVNGLIVASSIKDRIGQIRGFIKNFGIEDGKSVFVHEGMTFMKFMVDRSLIYYISMEGTNRTIRNYCYLAVSLIEVFVKSSLQKLDKEEIMRRIIQNQVTELEFQELVRDYKIDVDTIRCVFVISTHGMEADIVYNVLQKAFNKGQGDILVLVDSRTVALVKGNNDGMDDVEVVQLAEAMRETIYNEVSVQGYIGIGTWKPTIYSIRNSYNEAVKAIQVGSTYDSTKHIYMYSSLLMERFLYEVPVDICESFYKHIFNEESKKMLNEEMIVTIEKFFENSLNLSETARQLYIHRNTLVYRLDKIQKGMGLDLRNFHDAVTFKIMMMLERHVREC